MSRRLPAAVLLCGLLIEGLLLVRDARTLWFFGDDWDFLLQRGLRHDTMRHLFAPHNEHWSTVPIVAFRLVHAIWGTGSYLPFAVLPIGAHLLGSGLIYLVGRRAGVAPWPSALAALAVAFLAGGAGAENTLWDFQIGFTGSAVFGLAALWLALGTGRAERIGVALALVLSLMCAGTGLEMTAWVCLFVLLYRGWRAAVLTGITPALVYGAWFAAFGRHASASAPPPVPGHVPGLILRGLAHVWAAALSLDPVAGWAMLVLLVAATWISRRHGARFALAASGLIAMVLAYATFAYTRSGLGATSTLESRYLYFGLVFSAPALACLFNIAADRLRSVPWAAFAGVLALVVLIGALGLADLSHFYRDRHYVVTDSIKNLNASRAIIDSGAPLLTATPDARWSPNITVADLEGPLHGTLPRRRVGEAARLNARTSLQVAASAGPSAVASFDAVAWVGFRGVDSAPTQLLGCVTNTVQPHGARASYASFLVGAGGGQVRVQAPPGSVQVRLAEGPAKGRPVPVATSLGAPTYISSVASGTELRVAVRSGTLTVCPP